MLHPLFRRSAYPVHAPPLIVPAVLQQKVTLAMDVVPDRPNMNCMTEEEAKDKWCFVAQPGTGRTDSDGPNDPYSQTRCNASDCAAWRWFIDGSGQTTYGSCGLAGPSNT